MKKTQIQSRNFVIETDSVNENITLTHRIRSGNSEEIISTKAAEFPDLYNLIVAIAQVHPEWLTNTD